MYLSKTGFCKPGGRSKAHRFTPNALASYDTALHHDRMPRPEPWIGIVMACGLSCSWLT